MSHSQIPSSQDQPRIIRVKELQIKRCFLLFLVIMIKYFKSIKNNLSKCALLVKKKKKHLNKPQTK